jgi:hypothetical protein
LHAFETIESLEENYGASEDIFVAELVGIELPVVERFDQALPRADGDVK